MSKTVVFFGNERLATGVQAKPLTLQALLDSHYNLAKIFVKQSSKDSRRDKLEVEQIAESRSIPLSFSSDLAEEAEKLKELRPDIGVVVAYGLIIPQVMIDLFPFGIVNIHPSFLPVGRGPAPIEQTILDGGKETGVSIMRLTQSMDKGPILAQEKLSLSGKETKQELADMLLDKGSKLLVSCLSDIFSSKSTEREQSVSDAAYTHKISKSDGIIDWSKPASRLEREIRAFAGWPKSRTKLGGFDCIITQAEVVSEKGNPGSYSIVGENLIIFSGEDALSVTRLQPAGKKEMSVSEFLRGYKSRL